MNYLSDRARGLQPYVAGVQPKGSGWIKLNTNENPYPPSPKVIEALQNARASDLRLYPDGDSAGLREALAADLGVNAENIFAGNGSDEVLALAFQAFFSGRDNVLTPDISYGFYPVWCGMYGVKARFIPLGEGFALNARDYQGGNGVVLANPNAPTGIALALPEIEEIVKANRGGVVIVDEAYIDFANVASAIGLVGGYDNLLVVRTFSKSHSLAGLRVGYAAGHPKLISGLRAVKDAFHSYPLGMLAQALATAAIYDTGYREETGGRIVRTRDQTAARLRKLGWNVLPSQANFLFLEAENAKELYEYLLARQILVRYWDRPGISRFLRVTVGTDAEMEVLVQCIEKQRRQR